MNSRSVVGFLLLLSLISSLSAKKPGRHSPIEEARDHLEKAHSLITMKEEGGGTGKKRGKANIPNIINVLTDAELRLSEAKNNKGSNTDVALKFIADAKSELEAAKAGSEAEHLQKAEKAIDEALKRVMQGIRVHAAKS